MSEKDHVNILTEMRDERFNDISAKDQEKLRIEHNAPSFAISAIEENQTFREMLAETTEIQFGEHTYIRRLGGKPYEYGVVVDEDYGRGDYRSPIEAFKAIHQQGD